MQIGNKDHIINLLHENRFIYRFIEGDGASGVKRKPFSCLTKGVLLLCTSSQSSEYKTRNLTFSYYCFSTY